MITQKFIIVVEIYSSCVEYSKHLGVWQDLSQSIASLKNDFDEEFILI